MSELGEAFIMRGIEANVTSSNRRELERDSATWAGVIRRDDLESQ